MSEEQKSVELQPKVEYTPETKPPKVDTVNSHTDEVHKVDVKEVDVAGGAKVLLTGHKLGLLFLGLALSVFLAALDQTIVATAMPRITSDLKGFHEYAWIATSYLLTTTALSPLYGKFSDIFGRRPVLLFAIVAFEFGSLLCAVSTSMVMLIIARAIAGIGAGGLISLVMIVISDVVNMRDRGKYQGILGAMFGLASVIGPLLGGAFTDKVTWRWCFYINLPFGAITVIVILLYLDLPRPQTSIKEKLLQIDYGGVLTLVPAVILLLLSTSWGGSTYAWDSAIVISLYVVAVVIIAAFIFIETKIAKFPILEMTLFKIRNYSIGMSIAFLVGFCMMGTLVFLPIYFQVVKFDDATSSGLRMLPLMIPLVICSISSGIIVTKTGNYLIFLSIGTAILALGMGMIMLLEVGSSFGQMVGLLIPAGFGLGCLVQALTLNAQACVPPKFIAVATSSVNFFRNIGGVVGVAVFGAIMNNKVSQAMGGHSAGSGESFNVSTLRLAPVEVQHMVQDAYIDAVHTMFAVAIPFAGVAFFISLFLDRSVKLQKTLGAPPPIAE